MMAVNRRYFLKFFGFTAAVTLSDQLAWKYIISSKKLDAAEGLEQYPTKVKAKRWGMVIDIKKMTPELSKRIINACHINHNVPVSIPSPKNIKWIWETKFNYAFSEIEHEYLDERNKNIPFLVMCNHCENPACVRVCPTKATFKRPDGIVMMDMHRCIGCRFCMAGCPYGSRSFNFYNPRNFLTDPVPNKEYPTRTKGVVEKCTFCTERLDANQMPYCVESSEQTMFFGDMADINSPPRKVLRYRFSIRRNPGLGTQPQVYYLI